MWIVDGRRLEALRAERAMTRSELGRAAGVSERTICRLETGDAASPRLATLQLLATALGAKVPDFARAEGHASVAGAAPATEPPAPASTPVAAAPRANPLLRPSRMAELAAREAKAPPRPVLETPLGRAHPLGVRWTSSAYTSFRGLAGKLFYVEGVVEKHRGVPQEEADAIGGKNGIASRFAVATSIDDATSFSVTVFTRDAEHATHVHEATNAGRGVWLLVRLVAAPEGTFPFWFFESETPRPFAFVVEATGPSLRARCRVAEDPADDAVPTLASRVTPGVTAAPAHDGTAAAERSGKGGAASGKPAAAGTKTVASREKTGVAGAKTVASREKTGTAGAKTVASRERTGAADAKTVASRERTGAADAKTVASREKTGAAGAKTVASREKTGAAGVKTVASREKTGSSPRGSRAAR